MNEKDSWKLQDKCLRLGGKMFGGILHCLESGKFIRKKLTLTSIHLMSTIELLKEMIHETTDY